MTVITNDVGLGGNQLEPLSGRSPEVRLPAFDPDTGTVPDSPQRGQQLYKVSGRRGPLPAQHQRTDLALNALRNQYNVSVSGPGLGAGVQENAILAKADAFGGAQTIAQALRDVVQGGVKVEPIEPNAGKGPDRPSPARDESRTGKKQPATGGTDVQPAAGVSVGLTFWETALLAGAVILYFVLD